MITSGNRCECFIGKLKISEDIGYSRYRDSGTSKYKGIVFKECFVTVRTAISSGFVYDKALGIIKNGMNNLFLRIILNFISHLTTYRTLMIFDIQSDADVNSI